MNYFRSLELRLWGQPEFLALSNPPPSGRGLLLYLLLGPHGDGLPGLYRLGRAQLAEAADWQEPPGALDAAIAEVEAAGLARFDWRGRVVYVPLALEHQPPRARSNVAGFRERFALVPDGALKAAWAAAVVAHCRARGWAPPAWLLEDAGGQDHSPELSPDHSLWLSPDHSPHLEEEEEEEREEASRSAPPARESAASSAPRSAHLGASARPEHLPPEALALAAHLRERILANGGRQVPRDDAGLARWACDIERAQRIDDFTWAEIRRGIDIAQGDTFWSLNVRSGAKLRKHLDRLLGEAKRSQVLENGRQADTEQKARAKRAEKRPRQPEAPPEPASREVALQAIGQVLGRIVGERDPELEATK